jgi:Cdc6-like AAA superfamily ATPase
MKKVIRPNKVRGLYNKALIRLYEASVRSHKNYIPFSDVYEKLCRNFSINKAEVWDYILMFQELGFIEIVRTKGIRVKYTIKNG